MIVSSKSAVACFLCVLAGCSGSTTTPTAKSTASIPEETEVVPLEKPNAARKEKQVAESQLAPANSTDAPADKLIWVSRTSGGLALNESFTITLLNDGQQVRIAHKEYLEPKANEVTARNFTRTVTFGCLNDNMELTSFAAPYIPPHSPQDLEELVKAHVKSEIELPLGGDDFQQNKQDGFVYFAVKVEFRSGDDPLPVESNDGLDKSRPHRKEDFADWNSRMKFLKQLEPGQSGEFGGWVYQKIELSQASKG